MCRESLNPRKDLRVWMVEFKRLSQFLEPAHEEVTKMLALNYDKGTPGQKAVPAPYCSDFLEAIALSTHLCDVQCRSQITGTITVSVSCWECISLAHEPLAKIVAS